MEKLLKLFSFGSRGKETAGSPLTQVVGLIEGVREKKTPAVFNHFTAIVRQAAGDSGCLVRVESKTHPVFTSYQTHQSIYNLPYDLRQMVLSPGEGQSEADFKAALQAVEKTVSVQKRVTGSPQLAAMAKRFAGQIENVVNT